MHINQSRRHFIQASTALASSTLLPRISWAASNSTYNILPIPQLQSGNESQGVVRYQLNAQDGRMNFIAGLETPTLGYNGNFLGPTLRMKRGDKVRIDVTNKLNEVTTVHWHGMIIPAGMDGGPHQTIQPGANWRSEYAIVQPATTLFYHAHTHGQTGQQVYRGLAGLLIIDDEESMQSGLPSEYGVDDIPVVIQDRDINSDGSLKYIGFMPERMVGKHGKTLLVNGAVSPVLKAQKSLLRLRLLNASNARFYNLQFSDQRRFQVIASDGGLLENPVTVNRLEMAPAERVEILLDVSDRKKVMLQSIGGVGNANHGPMGMMGMDRPFDVLLIDAENAKQSDAKSPQQLSTHPDWSQQPIAAQRKLDLQMGMGGMMQGMMNQMTGGGSGGMMRINDKAFEMDRIDFALKKDSFEVWTLRNSSPMIHPFHIHNTQFKILSRNGKKPSAIENGFKDTVVVKPKEEVRILMPTGPYTDTNHPYMYHCHILEHEDAGMMGQFVVQA